MYNPHPFKRTKQEELHDFIDRYGFATLVSVGAGGLQVSHLPLILDRSRGKFGTLLGHLAKANPHWRDWTQSEVLCVFHGPQGYISPSWYTEPLNVPTWNYSVVHARGNARMIEELDEVERILDRLVNHHESAFEKPWKYDLPEDFRSGLTNAIVGFEIEIGSIEGKFKMSQNRSEADWSKAVEQASKHYSESCPDFAKMMGIEFRKRNP